MQPRRPTTPTIRRLPLLRIGRCFARSREIVQGKKAALRICCKVTRMPVTEATAKWVDQLFESSIVPTLVDYIKIPNKSVMFDPDWKKNGHMDRAVELLAGWAKQNLPEGAKLEVVRLKDGDK